MTAPEAASRTGNVDGSAPAVSLVKATAAGEQPPVTATGTGTQSEQSPVDDHAHVYGFMDVCEVEGCPRVKPAWLADTEREVATYAPRRRVAEGRFAAFRALPGPIRFGIIAVVYLAVLGQVAQNVSSNVENSDPAPPVVVRVP